MKKKIKRKIKAYLLDDTSGVQDFRDYKGETGGDGETRELSVGDFIAVYGNIKKAKGGEGVFLTAFKINRLDDKENRG